LQSSDLVKSILRHTQSSRGHLRSRTSPSVRNPKLTAIEPNFPVYYINVQSRTRGHSTPTLPRRKFPSINTIRQLCQDTPFGTPSCHSRASQHLPAQQHPVLTSPAPPPTRLPASVQRNTIRHLNGLPISLPAAHQARFQAPPARRARACAQRCRPCAAGARHPRPLRLALHELRGGVEHGAREPWRFDRRSAVRCGSSKAPGSPLVCGRGHAAGVELGDEQGERRPFLVGQAEGSAALAGEDLFQVLGAWAEELLVRDPGRVVRADVQVRHVVGEGPRDVRS
jgi:hypothetical protein